jgi:hypothetical protein
MKKIHRKNHQTVTNEDMRVKAYYPGGYRRNRWIKFQRFTEIVECETQGPFEIFKIPTDDMPNPEFLLKFTDAKYNQVVYTLHIGKQKLEEHIAFYVRQIEKEMDRREKWFERFKDSDEPA